MMIEVFSRIRLKNPDTIINPDHDKVMPREFRHFKKILQRILAIISLLSYNNFH